MVAVAVELHDEFLVTAVVTVGLHFLRRFIQKEDDGRGIAGDLRGIGDLAGRGCLTGANGRDIEITGDFVFDQIYQSAELCVVRISIGFIAGGFEVIPLCSVRMGIREVLL